MAAVPPAGVAVFAVGRIVVWAVGIAAAVHLLDRCPAGVVDTPAGRFAGILVDRAADSLADRAAGRAVDTVAGTEAVAGWPAKIQHWITLL